MTVVEQLRNRGVTPRAVLYARFSSDNQREESIEAQLRAMHEYCSRNSIVFIHEYCDRAKSATTDDRPEFLKMIAAGKGTSTLPSSISWTDSAGTVMTAPTTNGS